MVTITINTPSEYEYTAEQIAETVRLALRTDGRNYIHDSYPTEDGHSMVFNIVENEELDYWR